jgi:hypothetical protein
LCACTRNLREDPQLSSLPYLYSTQQEVKHKAELQTGWVLKIVPGTHPQESSANTEKSTGRFIR